MPPNSPGFSRKTVLAAVDLLSFTHAELTRFLLDLGPQYASPGGESISVAKRLNALISIYDKDPNQALADGEFLRDIIVMKAASQIAPVKEYEWSERWPVMVSPLSTGR